MSIDDRILYHLRMRLADLKADALKCGVCGRESQLKELSDLIGQLAEGE